jgi:hypothetical protein
METERVFFRLIRMPCCGQVLCWVNPRFPNFCPECGKSVSATVKECVLKTDGNALLTLDMI